MTWLERWTIWNMVKIAVLADAMCIAFLSIFTISEDYRTLMIIVTVALNILCAVVGYYLVRFTKNWYKKHNRK